MVLPVPAEQWRRDLLDAGLKEVALDGEMAQWAAVLDWDHRDPADRMIVASALRLQAALVTADQRILAWSGPLRCIDARH